MTELRRWLPAALLGLSGCTAPAPAGEPPGPALPGRADAPPPRDADELRALMQTLAAAAVRHDAPVRAVLYTWTTRAQTEALRARPVLLTRERDDSGLRSRFDAALAGDPHPIAARLLEPGRRARRFAWPLAWATAMGWDGAGYGPDLVRVELRPEALLARYAPGSASPWAFYDASGRAVAEAEVLAAPERLAAVYHVSPAAGERVAYREYVLVSEAMIAAWSIGTEDVLEDIRGSAALMTALAEKIDASREVAALRCAAEGREACPAGELPEGAAALAAWSRQVSEGPWTAAPELRDALLVDHYLACLALPGAPYLASGASLRAIAGRLRAEQPPPLRHRPDPSDSELAAPAGAPRAGARPRRCTDPSRCP